MIKLTRMIVSKLFGGLKEVRFETMVMLVVGFAVE